MRVTDPATSSAGAPTSAPVPRPSGPGPVGPRPAGPRPAAPTTATAAGEVADRALEVALARLDGLGAVGVHEHVEVYAGVDRALRERLATAEG